MTFYGRFYVSLFFMGIAMSIVLYFFNTPGPSKDFVSETNTKIQFINNFIETNKRLPTNQEYLSKYGTGEKEIEYITDGNAYFLVGWDGKYKMKYSSKTKYYEIQK